MSIRWGGTAEDRVVDFNGNIVASRRVRFWTARAGSAPSGAEFTALFSDAALTIPVTQVLSDSQGLWGPVFTADTVTQLVAGAETLVGGVATAPTVVTEVVPRSVLTVSAGLPDGRFDKADPASVCLTVAAQTLTVKAGTKVAVNGVLVVFATATAVALPALTAGTDVEVYALSNGTAQAVVAGSAAPANSRLIAGCHYAPGGNAALPPPPRTVTDGATTASSTTVTSATAAFTASDVGALITGGSIPAGTKISSVTNATTVVVSAAPTATATGVSLTVTPMPKGGDTVPAFNPFSAWDLKWRPACPSARGMTLVAGRFWTDIYLCGVNTDADGTSRFGVAIADGANPPKIPAMFGGNGAALYPNANWWTMAEVLSSQGKRPPSYAEFAALAYGVTEGTSVGPEPTLTALDAPRTSRWGVMQATGNMWIWSNEFGGPYAAAAWADPAGAARGQQYAQPNVALLGASWSDGGVAGSRSTTWNNAPSSSYSVIGGRGACDHLRLV